MSEYTPTISELRGAWLSAEFEERDSTTSDDDLRAEFDRALAAHDAEMRAGAVAEEPEWEYGVEMPLHTGTVVVASRDEATARAEAWLYPLHRRRMAGPWVPVKHEGSV